MSTRSDATSPLFLVDEATDPRWSVWDDGGAVTIRLSGHVDDAMAADAVARLTERVLARGRSLLIVADLLDVEGFDVHAPVAAARAARPIAHLIEHVDLIVVNRIVRIAAVSAAALLGLRCVVRTQR